MMSNSNSDEIGFLGIAVVVGGGLWLAKRFSDKLDSLYGDAKEVAGKAAQALNPVNPPLAGNKHQELAPEGPERDAQLAKDRAFLLKQGWTEDSNGLLVPPVKSKG